MEDEIGSSLPFRTHVPGRCLHCLLRHCHISRKAMSRSDLLRSQVAILNGGMEAVDGGRAIFRRL